MFIKAPVQSFMDVLYVWDISRFTGPMNLLTGKKNPLGMEYIYVTNLIKFIIVSLKFVDLTGKISLCSNVKIV
jgi:hypothetical protein